MTTVCSAEVTSEMVTGLTDEQVSELIESLDDAVFNIFEELGAE